MKTESSCEQSVIPRKTSFDLYQALEERHRYHKENADKQVDIFKRTGFAFGLTIPGLSAIVTFCAASEFRFFSALAAVMGFLLTLLTLLNSVLKPDERFARAAQYGIALHEWKREFDILVAETDVRDEKAFHAMIRKMDGELSKIGKEMAAGWVPKSAPEQNSAG